MLGHLAYTEGFLPPFHFDQVVMPLRLDDAVDLFERRAGFRLAKYKCVRDQDICLSEEVVENRLERLPSFLLVRLRK